MAGGHHKSDRPEASMSWLAHFATTTLQLNNVGAVIYGRGLGHIPETKGYTMGLLMWRRGPQGHIYFEEFRSATTSKEGLGGISLRQRHPDDWQEIRCVLWLITDDNEYVAQSDIGGRQTEDQNPPSEGLA